MNVVSFGTLHFQLEFAQVRRALNETDSPLATLSVLTKTRVRTHTLQTHTQVRRALNETDSPLAALTVLKKTCDHPALLSEGAAESVLAGGSRWAAM